MDILYIDKFKEDIEFKVGKNYLKSKDKLYNRLVAKQINVKLYS